jgi:hypothetical protein
MFALHSARSALRKIVPIFLAFLPATPFLVPATASAFAPVTVPSLTANCYYKVYGSKADGTAWNTGDWKTLNCASSQFDFSTIPNFGSIPDGVYFFELTSVDNAGNWMDSTKYGPYRIDTTGPKCNVTEVRLLAGNSANQYFDKATNTFYYKGTGGSGKFSVTVDAGALTASGVAPAKTCGTGGNEYCSAPLDRISFENTIGAGHDYTYHSDANWTTGTITQTQTHQYNWSGNNTYTGNVLSGNAPSKCIDAAGNSTSFQVANTRLVYEDGNYVLQPIAGMGFSPDTTAPTLSTSSFYFASGNDGTGPDELLYAGSQTKYLAALSNRRLSASVSDAGGAGVRPFSVFIEQASDKNALSQYAFTGSSYLSRVPGPVAVNITHDFSNAGGPSQYDLATEGYRPYAWRIDTKGIDGSTIATNQVCDMVGNCNAFPNTEFRIVANAPDASKTLVSNSVASKKIADGSDMHFTVVRWRDKYDNWVIPVKNAKILTTDANFANSLGLDQVTKSASDPNSYDKGTGVDFFFEDGYGGMLGGATHSPGEKKNFKFVTDDPTGFGMGETWVKLASVVPTHDEYADTRLNTSIYGSDPTRGKLTMQELKLTVTPENSYTSIGQSTFTCVGAASQCSGNPVDQNYRYEAPTYFSSLDKLDPVVENKRKNLNLTRTSSGSSISEYQLRTILLTNNPFFTFYDFQLNDSGNKRNDKYFIADNNLGWPVSQFASVDSDATEKDVAFAGYNGTSSLSFTPRTVGGITNANQNVALVSTLRYKEAGRYVQLPGHQVGLADYDKAYDAQLTPGAVAYGSVYDSASRLTLSEIDVRGIVQSGNNGNTNGAGAVTTSASPTKFRDFSSITLYDIKTNIQKNVAMTIAGADTSVADLAGGRKTINLDFASVSGGLKLQKDQVLYFKNGDVVIDCGGGDAVCDVTGRKTLIVENGNLFINSNIRYADGNSILGFILTGNKDNTKSRIYVSEKITNVSAIAYSEGPMESYNGNASSPKAYNGSNVGENDLLNQLYWFGSLVTRNTVGGGIKTPYSCPFGTPEYKQATCDETKSREYDLIYLRRYARTDQSEYPSVVGNPMGDGKVPYGVNKNDVKIAGGVKFAAGTAAKTAGPSTLKTFSNFDTPLAIEYDPKLQTAPPPGFEKNQ